jgi:hypothetical protein
MNPPALTPARRDEAFLESAARPNAFIQQLQKPNRNSLYWLFAKNKKAHKKGGTCSTQKPPLILH